MPISAHDTKLEAVVRQIMASGAACFVDKVSEGRVSMADPIAEAFGTFPREFLAIRPSIVDDLAEALADQAATA